MLTKTKKEMKLRGVLDLGKDHQLRGIKVKKFIRMTNNSKNYGQGLKQLGKLAQHAKMINPIRT
jgi:hypothetical protein